MMYFENRAFNLLAVDVTPDLEITKFVDLERFAPEITKFIEGTSSFNFEGGKTRKFHSNVKKRKIKKLEIPPSSCHHWFVLTGDITRWQSYNRGRLQGLHWYGSVAINGAISGKQKWCCVIVGKNQSTNHGVQIEGCLYLGPKEQRSLPYEYSQLVPPNNLYGMKNIGYLFAIHHGAKVIFDGDEYNIFIRPNIPLLLESASKTLKIQMAQTRGTFLNPYLAFGPNIYAQPRGFPLPKETSTNMSNECSIPINLEQSSTQDASGFSIGIIQILADSPDQNGLERVSQRRRVRFTNPCKYDMMVLPPGVASPYNNQATLHMYASFFGLHLPITINEYLADIWRGYFTQGLLWKLGITVAIQKPFTVRKQKFVEKMDSLSEYNANQKILSAVDFITKWTPSSTSLPELMQELAIEFYEREYWEEADVLLLKAWINDLQSLDYQFPEILPPHYVAYAKCMKSVELCAGDVNTFQNKKVDPSVRKSNKLCCRNPLHKPVQFKYKHLMG